MNDACKNKGIAYDLVEFRKVPRIPFPYAHCARIEIFIDLIEKTDCLNDHIILAIDIKLDLGTGVRVAQTELGAFRKSARECLDVLLKVKSNAANNFENSLVGRAGKPNGVLDRCANIRRPNTKRKLWTSSTLFLRRAGSLREKFFKSSWHTPSDTFIIFSKAFSAVVMAGTP